jgi:hypothetical protein
MTIEERIDVADKTLSALDLLVFNREARLMFIESLVKASRRDGIEEEREACAKIAADFREEAGRADCGAEFYKTASSVIRDRIRARSNS